MKTFSLILLLALGAAALPAAGQPAADKGAISPTPRPEPIAPVTPKPAVPADNGIAALILAGEETTLSSQMAGRIVRVSVGLGDAVKKGTRVIEFDCAEQRAQLDAAEAEYRAARETHLARLRLQALGAAGELDVTVAAATADRMRGQMEMRKAQMAYCRVNAPFSGNVARLRVKAAESVQLGQPLVDLVNPRALKAQMFVPASWVAWLRVGTRLTISVAETGESFPARVSKMNSRVDGVSQQLELEARVDKDGKKLLPGMVGTARFEGAPNGK